MHGSSEDDLYSHTPAHKPLPWGLNNCNFGRLFLGHHQYILSLTEPCHGETNFTKYNFKLFTPKSPPPGMGVMKYTISCLYIPKLEKIGPVVLEKKMLTHDTRRTMTDVNS